MKQDFIDPDTVHDRKSFMEFIDWLCTDRRQAEEIERTDPDRYRWSGANGWQNTEIVSFLEAAVAGVGNAWGAGTEPSWKDLAVFLYLGKIYE